MTNRVTDIDKLRRMMELIKCLVFPDYSVITLSEAVTDEIQQILDDQLPTVLDSGCEKICSDFMTYVPEIRRLIYTDVDAVMHNDPAVQDFGEVVLCYPLVTVMLHYRTAHRLHELGVPRLPRILTEMAHSATGIDIHPAAKIGEYFAIDHGTGVVIGATSIIGNHCMLYQGVTLGAKNFTYDDVGHPVDIPRHPILEDNVTVYSNTSILGRVTIGHDSVIGGNLWLTYNIPPYSRIVQTKAVQLP